jgi:hypothetical protein
MTPNPNPSPELIEALKAWQPEGDDRVRPLLLAEADRRDAVEYNVTDANHVIAFLLARLDAALSPQTLPAPGEVEDPDHQYAVVSADYRRPFLAGAYATLEAALRAQDGKPDRWHIYHRLAATVAAANDEAFARGVEAAAKWHDQQVIYAAGRQATHELAGGDASDWDDLRRTHIVSADSIRRLVPHPTDRAWQPPIWEKDNG